MNPASIAKKYSNTLGAKMYGGSLPKAQDGYEEYAVSPDRSPMDEYNRGLSKFIGNWKDKRAAKRASRLAGQPEENVMSASNKAGTGYTTQSNPWNHSPSERYGMDDMPKNRITESEAANPEYDKNDPYALTTMYDRQFSPEQYGVEPVESLEFDDYIKKMYDITRPDYQYPNNTDDGYRTIYDDPGITYDPPRGRIPDDEYRTIDDRPLGMDIYAHESDKSNYFSNFPDQGPPNIDYDASFGEDDSEPDPSLESQYRTIYDRPPVVGPPTFEDWSNSNAVRDDEYRTIYDRPPGSSNALPFVPRKDFGNFSTRRGKLWDPKQRENTLTRDSSGGVLVPKQRGGERGGIGLIFDRQTKKQRIGGKNTIRLMMQYTRHIQKILVLPWLVLILRPLLLIHKKILET